MTDYIRQMTEPRYPFEQTEAQRLADSLQTEATVTDGVLRWNSHGRVPPREVVDFAEWLGMGVCVLATTRTRDEETSQMIAEYRAARKDGPTAEERFSARAAHGPDVEMIDIVTGHRWRT